MTNKYQKNIFKENAEVASFLKQNYINPFLNGELENFAIKPKKNLTTNKIIWQFWQSKSGFQKPEIVEECMDSVQKYKGDYEVIVLDLESVKEYIELPEFIYEKHLNNPEFKIAFLTDLIRICLLQAYGGIWIDATILLTAPIESNLLEQDLFMYQRGERPKKYKYWQKMNRDYFSWEKNWRVNVLNSFIIAKPNNKILEALINILVSYWQKEDSFKHYFIFQIIFDLLVKETEYSKYNCQIVDDTLPHLMHLSIYEEYSDELWQELCEKSSIHKLTYYDRVAPNTILAHILNKTKDDLFYNIAPKTDVSNITFCSMLFNMKSKNLDKIKQADRKFESFYLKSLKQLSSMYKQMFIWCDQQTADFIENENLDIKYKVYELEDLPRYKNRDKYIEFLKQMKKLSFNQGYLLKDLEPEDVVDYLIVVLTKLDVIKDAKDEDNFNSDYFYWIDAGTCNPVYERFWMHWYGRVELVTQKSKFAFMTFHKRIKKSLYKVSSFEDIALIKAPFEISASKFVLNKAIVDEFYQEYLNTIDFYEHKNMITTEQSIFSAMLKRGNEHLFDFAKTFNYIDVMNLIARPDTSTKVRNDKLAILFKTVLLKIAGILPKKLENEIRQSFIYKEIKFKDIRKQIITLKFKKKKKHIKILGITLLKKGV